MVLCSRRTLFGAVALATALSVCGAVPAVAARACPEAHGRVVGWGFPAGDRGQLDVPAGLADVRAVAAGRYHVAALRCNGTVVAWGANEHGQATPPKDLHDVVDIASGMDFSVALLKNGTVRTWGMLNEGDPFDDVQVPKDLGPVRDIAANDRHVVALLRDGQVRVWGRHDTGQADVPAGLRDVVSVGAGPLSSLALLADGTAISWGYDPRVAQHVPVRVNATPNSPDTVRVGNNLGQSEWNVGSIAGFYGRFAQIDLSFNQFVGVRRDGSAYVKDRNPWADPWEQVDFVAGLRRVKAVDADLGHTVILANGVVYDWLPTGVRRPDVRGAIAISAGDGYGLAIVR
ncbi:MAG: RCC1 domain-containing protein [Sporichthyaceae bacterium]